MIKKQFIISLYLPVLISVLVSFKGIYGSNITNPLNSELLTQDKPNIIFFALDDLNIWINPMGHSQAITPNFDRLAKSGVTFTNAHAPNSYCAPSRTAIWTGLQSTTTGCYTYEVYQYDYPNLVPLQMAFKNGGYDTYGAGKLYHHNGGYVDLRAWDDFYARSNDVRRAGYPTGYKGEDLPYPKPYPYSPYHREMKTKPKKNGRVKSFMEWGPIADKKSEKMPDNMRTNWICDLLEKDHKNPFFIGLGLFSPHFPNYAPQKYFDMYDVDKIQVPESFKGDLDDIPLKQRTDMLKRKAKYQDKLEELGIYKEAIRAYLASVSYADAMLGRVLDALEKSKYKDNTVVVLWSDQGYHHGEKGNWGKHTLWQQTSHVPFLFSGSNLKKGIKVDSTVGLIDIYPTLMELCGLDKPHKLDGVSLVPSLYGKPMADRDLFIPHHHKGNYAVVNSSWRYIHYNDGSEELYDLKKDPNEWYNLAGQANYQNVISDLKKAAPKTFRRSATSKKNLKLVVEAGKMYWKGKNGTKPQMTY